MDSLRHGHRALRRGRHSAIAQVYFVTFTTLRRRPQFSDPCAARTVARTLCNPVSQGSSRILCWVLMPDHWHGLVELGSGDSLGRFVLRLKARTAKAWNRVRGGAGPLWARAFHDHALRRDEDLVALARYVVANPLRAGLVRRLGDYPYWDAIWL
ncbi:MAG TPA: transposase [Xanthomonadaceae bacterium]|nr:transposase [Xanthomonadaceae bacterium]